MSWPDCQMFMEDETKLHLIDDDVGYDEFGDSAYFVELGYYQSIVGTSLFENEPIYYAISFPESKFFIEQYSNEVCQVSSQKGKEKYGEKACFIDAELYMKFKEELLKKYQNRNSFELDR